MMVKQLAVVLTVSALMTACGGSSDKKKSSSSSSVTVVSSASSAAVSSAASSAAVSSSASSVVESSAASSVAVSSSSSSEIIVISSSSSSEASSVASSAASSAASSSSSSSGNAVNCDPNPNSVIDLCDMSKWEVLNEGGSIAQGELGPIYTVGAPSNYDSGMAYVLTDATLNAVIRTKSLNIVFVADQAFVDSKASLQFIVQQKGGSYAGDWDCGGWVDTGNIVAGQEMTGKCENVDSGPADGAESIFLGFQVKPADPKVYDGTISVIDATWE